MNVLVGSVKGPSGQSQQTTSTNTPLTHQATFYNQAAKGHKSNPSQQVYQQAPFQMNAQVVGQSPFSASTKALGAGLVIPQPLLRGTQLNIQGQQPGMGVSGQPDLLSKQMQLQYQQLEQKLL